jgi:branched-chain amino acid transport system substrate-binding protein
VPKATIKIASHFPMTGGLSDFGGDLTHAAEMAVKQLVGPLQELGYKIELVSFDDQDSIDVAVTNANEIIADPEILCGVGHYTSRIMIQASEIYHKAGLAFVSPSNTSTTVTDRGYLEVNRVVGRNDGQGMAGAQFAKEQGFAAVYIITQSGDYGKKNADFFKREADHIGLPVVGTFTTDITENFESVVTRMMSANPDLVYFSSTADQVGPFIREARAAGYSGAFLGIDGANTPDLLNLAGPLILDGGGMYYTEMAAPASFYPDAAKFVEDFQILYGTNPLIYTAQAYDATGICIKAIEESVKAKNGELPTREEVANAIRALVDYKGITGTFSFNKKGDPVSVKYYVYQVTSVDPANWGQNPVYASYDVAPP